MKISNVYSYPAATNVIYLTPNTAEKASESSETKEVHKLSNEIALINKQTSYIKENKLDFASLSNANRVKLLDTY
ncbi:MAG: hypothetical protein A2X86_03210 [Bdellovibrionales bacterium GWA2_49_15]|nr:MAG: hypothetical protein A2X86_03210 [Bdellovibrionales bacterium GWA2_49_15]HAZ12223.1 hypothetical protein [Bdellovibrionales bacterium]